MALALLLPWLSACNSEQIIPAGVVGYNHTDKNIGTFSVRIGKSRGGGGFLEAHRGGGSMVCCVGFPDPWRPGLTAIVGWTDNYNKNYQEREIPIPEYDAKRTGSVKVHFLRNGEIKIFLSLAFLGNPNYPLKGPEAGLYPGEDPVEVWKYGRKQGKE
jgi:hypothetical protein